MSASNLFDQLYHDEEFVMWCVYTEMDQYPTRLACVYKNHYFTWNTHDLKEAVHSTYSKTIPEVAYIDQEARHRAHDVVQRVGLPELILREQIAQRHWSKLEVLDDCTPQISKLVLQEKQARRNEQDDTSSRLRRMRKLRSGPRILMSPSKTRARVDPKDPNIY